MTKEDLAKSFTTATKTAEETMTKTLKQQSRNIHGITQIRVHYASIMIN